MKTRILNKTITQIKKHKPVYKVHHFCRVFYSTNLWKDYEVDTRTINTEGLQNLGIQFLITAIQFYDVVRRTEKNSILYTKPSNFSEIKEVNQTFSAPYKPVTL